MRLAERNEIIRLVHGLFNEELEREYYDTVYDSLNNQSEKMYEMCYDIKDIVEEEEIQEYLSEKADLLGRLCDQRGIKLWEGMNEK